MATVSAQDPLSLGWDATSTLLCGLCALSNPAFDADTWRVKRKVVHSDCYRDSG